MKIAILDKIDDEAIKLLEEEFDVDILTDVAKDKLVDHIAPYNCMVVRSATKVTEELLDAAKNLQVVARAGTGIDTIDVDHASKKKIPVMNTPGSNSLSVAELTMGLILNLARHVTRVNNELKDKNWHKMKGIELQGKTLGIIGFGRIGRKVADRAKAFGMNIMAYDVFSMYKNIEEAGARTAEIDEIMKEADFITLHIPLTKQTEKLIDERRLALMKKTAYIINTSRGGLIDEEALVAALDQERIAGAALDVYTAEPPYDSELLALSNTICTPHIGASTYDAQKRCGLDLAHQIIEFFQHDIKRNIVNLDNLNAHGFPELRIIPMSRIDAHELTNDLRVSRLQATLKKDGIMKNPIVAADFDGKHMIVDGATRHQSLKNMGAQQIVAHIVDYDSDQVTLDTWDHGLKRVDFKEILRKLDNMEGVDVEETSWDVAERRLLRKEIMGYLVGPDETVVMLRTKKSYEDLVEAMCKVGEMLKAKYDIVRITHDQIEDFFESQPQGAVMCWKRFTKTDIKKIFEKDLKVPAGITRHLVPCRVLGLNLQLQVLIEENAIDNVYLKDLVRSKLRQGKVRFYNEPIYVLNN